MTTALTTIPTHTQVALRELTDWSGDPQSAWFILLIANLTDQEYEADPWFYPSQITSYTGLGRASVSSKLNELVRERYLAKRFDGRGLVQYQLGARIIRP